MRLVFFLTTLVLTGWVYLNIVHAQVRTSNNYQIQSDSINVGGGLSSSTNYSLESTAGEVATGPSDGTTYNLRAGYQQMQEVFLSLTGGADVNMTPSLPGVGGGISNGSTTLTAVTDSPSGYQLTIEASESPAMTSGSNTIADYSPSGDPDLVFTTASVDAHLGYSPFGNDVVQKFQTNGSVCNVSGSASSTACWEGLSTTAETISQSSSPNQPAGTDTTIYFKVGIGPSVVQIAGTYVATSTVTLLAL
ncbi:hypothetical protein N8083_00035 [Candidatus Pacebacteria bacterium]|nr:hypothetical protein [Candidatus Paceibacterota bacterium]